MKECNRVKGLFGPYLYNSVMPTERADVEEHINRCKKCADDLQSRQKILGKLKAHPQFGEMPQRTRDSFAGNVYRKIASDALRRQSRLIFLRRFVLQPSLAAVVVAVGIAIGVFRSHQDPVMVHEPSSVAVKTDETDKKELRAALYVEEFFRRQGTSYQRGQGYATADKSPTIEPPSPDTHYSMQDALLPDSWRRLEDAHFINYSLGDQERALAEYQRLVDYYPDTDAAMEARGRIKGILDAEHNIRIENASAEQTTDMGI